MKIQPTSSASQNTAFVHFLPKPAEDLPEAQKPIPGSQIALGNKTILEFINSLDDKALKKLEVVDRAELLRLLSLDVSIERNKRIKLLEKIYKDYNPDYETGGDIEWEIQNFVSQMQAKFDLRSLLTFWPKEQEKQEKYLRQIHGVIADSLGFKSIPVSITNEEPKEGNGGGNYDPAAKTIKVHAAYAQEFGNALLGVFHESIHHWQALRLEKFIEKNTFKVKDKKHSRNLMLWAQNLPENYIRANESKNYNLSPDEKENNQIAQYALGQLGFMIKKAKD